jgi:hypothetical protein
MKEKIVKSIQKDRQINDKNKMNSFHYISNTFKLFLTLK